MSTTTTPLLPGYFYHIYNRGINKEVIFKDDENYRYFLQLMGKYLNPIILVYAYCLLPNHFHILISPMIADKDKLHLPLSHLFNTYTQSFNRRYNRTGALFERPFKRKQIMDETYLWQVICYIHNNPDHHYLGAFDRYPWSSYLSLSSKKPTLLKRDFVLSLFGGYQDFITAHENEVELRHIRDYLIEK